MSRFRPGWLPSLAVLLLFPGLLWLGFWQLSRADEKEQLAALFESRREALPLSVAQLREESDVAYRRVHLQGHFDAGHSLLLDNRTRAGQAGIELLQPFFDEPSGQWLLVNRGWQAWPDRRQPPQFSTPERSVSLYGWVYLPLGEPFQLHGGPLQARWPWLVGHVDVAEVARGRQVCHDGHVAAALQRWRDARRHVEPHGPAPWAGAPLAVERGELRVMGIKG